jgi:predicted porin
MQKKLLGMAVATALAAPAAAFAQSAVQVYGTAHMSFNYSTYGAGTATATQPDGVPGVSKMAVNSHASNFGIRSSESLGGGMTAWVQYEFNVKMERDFDLAGANGSSRNTAIGLRGNFGNVYLGTWETPWAATFRLWDVGTIGGWGPTTSIIGRRETTASGPSANCATLTAGAGVITGGTVSGTTAICYHAEGPGGAYPLWRRYGSAAFYDSPVFSGFQFKIGYQPNETKASFSGNTDVGTTTKTIVAEDPMSWSASLTWTGMGGKARAFLANMQSKDWSTPGKTDGGYTVGGGYDFGVVNIGAVYETYNYETLASATNPVGAPGGKTKAVQWGVGIAIPLGSGKIGMSYAQADDLDGGNLGTITTTSAAAGVTAGDKAKTGAKMYNIGYEWALSKRTAVGFGYAAIKNDDLASFTWTGMAPNQSGGSVAALGGSDVSNIFVAFRHSF